MSDDGVKTEQPTEKRLRETQEKGQFARSPDVHTVFVLTAALVAIGATVTNQCRQVASIAVTVFAHLGKFAIKPEGISEWTGISATTVLGLVLPVGLACGISSAVAGGLQSRFRLTPKALTMNFDRLDPIEGFHRIFSSQTWSKLGIDSVKLVVVGFIVWGAIKAILSDPIFYTLVPPDRFGGFLYDCSTGLLSRLILALAALGAANYWVQHKKTRADQMMSRHEVKEENKQSEGDPLIKSMLRSLARRLSQRQMLGAVPTADVVITNPTHYAVALKYERGKDNAPVVLAKGERRFARRIKELAAQHEVPMVENKPVARMLFKYGKVGRAIPAELYQAVAEILAYVYRTHRYYFHQLKERRAELAAGGIQ